VATFVGTYKKFTSSSREILQAGPCLRDIDSFLLIGEFYPVLTLIWGQYLTHVGYVNLQEWGLLTGTMTRDSNLICVGFEELLFVNFVEGLPKKFVSPRLLNTFVSGCLRSFWLM